MEFGVCALFFFLAFIIRVQAEPGEPKCYSRFDYDEKLLMKLLKIDDKVEKFENKLELFDGRVGEFDKTITMINKNYQLNEEIRNQTLTDLIEHSTQQEQNRDSVLETILAKVNDSLADIQSSVQKDSGVVVAFTATGSVDGPSSGVLTFSTVVTNEGNGFNSASGEFTCTAPGLYYFIFHLVKKRDSSVDLAGCNMGLNGSDLAIKAAIDPQDGTTGADNGSYGVSNSVYLRLNTGDTVRLQSCAGGSSPANRLDSQSSFSGFLVRPNA